jgi:hypothetical protein
MNKDHRIKVGMVLLVMTLCASTVLADGQGKNAPPMPPPPVQSLANNGYLYVLAGSSVHQYKLPDMTLQKTVTLPPAEDSNQVNVNAQRPSMPPALTLIIDEENLYLLYLVNAGYIYQYSLPDLSLEQIQTLPKPDFLR